MLRYDLVDVFTDRPFAGNQLAVVHNAADLSSEQCLAVAREFDLSETTFPVVRDETSYDIRIFTPGGELPFAGHPTLGTAWVLRHQGALTGPEVTQHCGAGEISVRFPGDSDELVELTAERRDSLGPLPRDLAFQLLSDLGLSSVDFADQPTFIAGTGLNFVHLQVHPSAVPLANPMTVSFRDYDLDFSELGTAQDPIEGVNLYSVEHRDEGLLVRSRVFVPGLKIPEDAATGSAATGLGLVLAQLELLPDGGRFEIVQGVELGRPSRIFVHVEGDLAHVSGGVQRVGSGEIRVP